jgi:hypothetical protein
LRRVIGDGGDFGSALEQDISTGGIQSEIGMERPARGRLVFSGGEHDEEFASGEIGGGKIPGAGGWGIAECPASEVEGFRGNILDFDPVGSMAIFIDETLASPGAEFRDAEGRIREERSTEPKEDDGSPQHAFQKEDTAGHRFARAEC